MSREQATGKCDKCSASFGYLLIHNGFNDSSYAYCDSCCYVALLDHYAAPKHAPKLDFRVITLQVEQQLLPGPDRVTSARQLSHDVPIAMTPSIQLKLRITSRRMQPGQRRDGAGNARGVTCTVLL
jgi:hypothetical protein